MFSKKKIVEVTENEQQSESKAEFFQSMLDLVGHGVSFYDKDHYLIFENKIFRETFLSVTDDLPQPIHITHILKAFLTKSQFEGDIESEVKARYAKFTVGSAGQEVAFPNGDTISIHRVARADGAVISMGVNVTPQKKQQSLIEEEFSNYQQRVAQELKSAGSEIQDASMTLGHSCDGISKSADGALELSTAISNSTEEMSSSINEIASRTDVAASKCGGASEMASETEVKVMELANAVERIEAFAATIQAIADQTNLLALNATIEAARAGDAGRGFAVVAAEVKSLSQQTASATSEISSQIEDVRSVSSMAAHSIEQISASIREISEMSSDTASAVSQQVADDVRKNSETLTGTITSIVEQGVQSIAK